MFYKTHGEQTKKFKLDFKAELVSSKKGKKTHYIIILIIEIYIITLLKPLDAIYHSFP